MMNTIVEMNDEMLVQVNGGKCTSYMGNPISTNAPWSSKDEKKENNE